MKNLEYNAYQLKNAGSIYNASIQGIKSYLSKYIDNIKSTKIYTNYLVIRLTTGSKILIHFTEDLSEITSFYIETDPDNLNVQNSSQNAQCLMQVANLVNKYSNYLLMDLRCSFLMKERIAELIKQRQEEKNRIVQEKFETICIENTLYIEESVFLRNDENAIRNDLLFFAKELLGDWKSIRFSEFFSKRKTVDCFIVDNDNNERKERINKDHVLYLLGSGTLSKKYLTLDQM